MALKAQITGFIADPQSRKTADFRDVLQLRINATLSTRDRETGEWSDVGEPLWVGASFWDQQAVELAELLNRGDRVTVEGSLTVRSYQRKDGTTGIDHELHFPRFLGVIPSRRNDSSGSDPANSGAYSAESGGAPF